MSDLRIVSLTVSNFKRIELVEIRPDGAPVEVTGDNEQGKSSLLDSIVAALGGGKAVPEVPVRRGATSASVALDLGDLLVERRWTNPADRVGSLVVRTKEGAAFPRAQEKLSGLLDSLTFDPLSFLSLPPAEQRALLLRALGVDVESFDRRRQVLFDERTPLSRELRAVEARLAATPTVPDDTPEEEVSTESLLQALEDAQATFRANDDVRANAARAAGQLQASRLALAGSEKHLETLEAEIVAARARVAAHRLAADRDAEAAKVAEAELAVLVDPPMDEIQGRFRSAEGTNRNVRALQARRALESEIERLQRGVAERTAGIAAVDQEKAGALAAAPLPVEGLAVAEDGVLLDGLPLSQASQMRQIRVCTRIAASLHPALRIALIRKGNDLSSKAMAEFYAECAALGIQPWVERISPTRGDAIEIVAGRVAGAEVADV